MKASFKKALAIVLILVSLLSLFVGCGDGKMYESDGFKYKVYSKHLNQKAFCRIKYCKSANKYSTDYDYKYIGDKQSRTDVYFNVLLYNKRDNIGSTGA